MVASICLEMLLVRDKMRVVTEINVEYYRLFFLIRALITDIAVCANATDVCINVPIIPRV